MPITKEAIEEQVAEIQRLQEAGLKNLPVEEQARQFLAMKKYFFNSICSALGMKGQTLAEIKRGMEGGAREETPPEKPKELPASRADLEHEIKTRETARQPSKPIVAKEIEDAAWFHNLLHDVGNHVYHSVVTHVVLGEEELRDYEKARAKIVAYYDVLESLMAEADKVVEVEVENAELSFALELEQAHRAKLQRFIDVVTAGMCRECRIRALTTFVLAPDTILGAQTK
jgi:hypothetical protein